MSRSLPGADLLLQTACRASRRPLEATKSVGRPGFIGSYCAGGSTRCPPIPSGVRAASSSKLDKPGWTEALTRSASTVTGEAKRVAHGRPRRSAGPLYEKCRELGLNNVAIHKSLLARAGAGTGHAFHPEDVRGAALAFRTSKLSIVPRRHGVHRGDRMAGWRGSEYLDQHGEASTSR